MKKIIALVLVLAAAGGGVWYRSKESQAAPEKFRFVKVERGDLQSVVSSTGTLSAVSTVQVGTQVSGSIARILVDFNDKVTQGQLLAVLDTTFLATSVRDAEASYERARSQTEYGQEQYQRLLPLLDKGMAAQTDVDQAKYSLDQAKAGLKSAKAALDRTRINLKYAWIYAPIDGTIVDRKVDGGQTVAASLSAPTLFLIANDLSKMQILANVDESDIGQIQQGQQVRFTVQAQPQRKFTGTVAQIRLQPTTIQNVVNYTVVVNVGNEEGLLLPGMTATIDFIIDQATGVLKLPNAALRFKPSAESLAALRPPTGPRDDSTATTNHDRSPREGRARSSASDGPGGQDVGHAAGRESRDSARVWYLDPSGQLLSARVKPGITDGQMTEIGSDELTEGQEVIGGSISTTVTAPTASSPFPGTQPQPQFGGRGRGPGF